MPTTSKITPFIPRHKKPDNAAEHFMARRFAFWFFEGGYLESDDAETDFDGMSEAKQIHDAFYVFKDDLQSLWDRMMDMDEYEREVLNDLRNKGAGAADLIDYIRAEPGFNPENRAVRSDVATQTKQKLFLHKSKKMEGTVRAGAIVAASLLLLGVGAIAVTAGATAGMTMPLWIPKVLTVAKELIQAAAGGGLLVLGWRAYGQWNKLKHGAPKLSLGSDKDFMDLKGFGHPNYEKLNNQWESIPSSDQHLIKHLTPTELRMLLMGSDATRLHILRHSPPSLMAKIEAHLEPVLQPNDSNTKNILSLCKVMFTAPWRGDQNDAGVSGLREKIADWRLFAQANKDMQNKDTQKKDAEKPKSPKI